MPRIPTPVLNNLRCVQCDNWLSCGPIRVVNGNSICGRCQKVRTIGITFRHLAFEALASYFRYPCAYFNRGCNAELGWRDVLEHEKGCSYGPSCMRMILSRHLCKRERKLDLSQFYTLVNLPDVVTEYLRCDSCDLYLSSTPIIVCKDGSSRCHRCGPPPNEETTPHKAYEILAGITMMPCIFRLRGCANKSKYGDDVLVHESECPFSRTYHKKQQIYKEKGVIQTHSGHVYATITPSSILFAPPDKTLAKFEQDRFLNNLRKHHHYLANRWGREDLFTDESDVESTHEFPRGLQKSRYFSEGEDSSAGVSRSESFLRQEDFDKEHPNFIMELKEKQRKVRESFELKERRRSRDKSRDRPISS